MECLACGNNVKNDNKFCQYCGHDLTVDYLKTRGEKESSNGLA
ncbi:zinc-ribbon domain-containing protein [Staphylococcus capitis]|nr:zinc ribbon domain-containing protein [Staphylococcus capitis]RQX47412.1 zinc-ribbon domain-containing protein [Staphylococcus capitis]